MRYLIIYSLVLSIVTALQIPFTLDSSPFTDFQFQFKDKIPTSIFAQLQHKWNELELRFGPQFMNDNYNHFKLVHFSKDINDYTYSIKTLNSNPEILGFDSVKQFTGYFQVEELDKEYFFWFFESRNDPSNDPLIVWLNGGPGCSDATGLAFELGPSLINSTLQPQYNPYSWNSNASILFLDQPTTVGFSHGGKVPFTTEESSHAFVNFIKEFHKKFPNYSNLDLHIAGESYAGHYIPKYATSLINSGIKLKSIMIGNGLTDPLTQFGEKANMGCGKGGIGQIYTDKECEEYPKAYESFIPYGKLCYKTRNPLICFLINFLLPDSPEFGDINPYDSRLKCETNSTDCYSELENLNDYFNLPYVQNALGVPETNFTLCNSNLGFRFLGDIFIPYHEYVAELLNKNIPVLIYVGDKDLVCDWVGNLKWVNELDYKHHEQFNQTGFKPWYTNNGTLAGEVKNYQHFTYLRVYDSGHYVPTNQAFASLDMVNRWVRGEYNLCK